MSTKIEDIDFDNFGPYQNTRVVICEPHSLYIACGNSDTHYKAFFILTDVVYYKGPFAWHLTGLQVKHIIKSNWPFSVSSVKPIETDKYRLFVFLGKEDDVEIIAYHNSIFTRRRPNISIGNPLG
jgi:hypothetical protein